jgi:hypothetical protein
MSRQWPPGWEDPEDLELDQEEPDAETEARLSEVAAFLAAVPAPVLPGAIESRIIAALAAESAVKAAESAVEAAESAAEAAKSADRGKEPAHEPDLSRILRPRPAPARARVRRHRRISPAMVAGPLLACLLFTGIGFGISLSGGSSASSSAPMAEPAESSAAASGGGAVGPDKGFSSAASAPSYRAPSSNQGPNAPFTVIHSGIDYQAAVLAAQVRSTVVKFGYDMSKPTSVSPATPIDRTEQAPAASASSTQSSAITPGLRRCVLHLTGEVAPSLIDRASYQGTPAYVIATASKVWVVGLDCTAARPDVIASASLAS